MFKKGTLYLIFLLSLTLNSFSQDSTFQKVNPAKSWGIGINQTGVWNYDWVTGIDFFYQKYKHEFGLTLFWPYYGGITAIQVRHNYYPNEWKKRIDLSIESSLVVGNSGYNLTTGYGLRVHLLKHFYLVHNFGFGASLYRRYDIYPEVKYSITRALQIKIGFQINLNSFRWGRE